MLDLNHLLLFIAIVSPAVLLVRTWRNPDLHRGWRLAAVAVLIVAGIAWLIARPLAGFISGGAWLALLLAPAVALRQVNVLSTRQNFGAAFRLARAVRPLHPSRGLREQTEVLRALHLAQRGDEAAATRLLERVARGTGDHARHARAQDFRIRCEWEQLRAWFEQELSAEVRCADVGLLPLYLRALGETGAINEMVSAFSSRAHILLGQPQHQPIFSACLLPVLAFTGRTAALSNLLSTTYRSFPRELTSFWSATAELAGRDTTVAVPTLETLGKTTTDALIRTSVRRRLDSPPAVSPALLSPESALLMRPFERNKPVATGPFGARSARPTAAVLILISLNLLMFALEITHGGSTNPLTLHRLGQLEPWSVRYRAEYWRMFTALFLHYGPLHLAFNLYALWIIGPGLERAIGFTRFLLCYVLTGVASSAGVVLLRIWRFTSAEQLVGASGCVMGIVGVWVGSLVRQRDAPFAGQRLRSILVIVAIQTAFDLWTPQISMAAHLSGLAAGIVFGLLIGPRQLRV